MSDHSSDSNSSSYDKSLFEQLKKALVATKIEGCSRSQSNSPDKKSFPQTKIFPSTKKESLHVASKNSLENKTDLIEKLKQKLKDYC